MKQSTIVLKNKTVDQFFAALADFPVSPIESTVQYDTGKLIKILREKEINNICDETEAFDTVNKIDIDLGKVVRELVQEIDPEKSLEEYYTFERRIEKETSGDLYIFARQGALSVKSLYHYKVKEWDKAIAATLECIALNDYLIQNGMYTLNLRVFEQNKNISRIHFRSGDDQAGHALLFNLFNYMFNGVQKGLHGSIFKHQLYWSKAPIIRETYTYEMFGMIAEDMIRFNVAKRNVFFPNQWYKGLDFEVDNPNRQVIYNWMYVNNKLHEQEYEEYFDCLTYYLNQPIPQYYDMLKIFLLIELNKLIAKSNYKGKAAAQDKIKYFIQHKIESFDKVRNLVLNHYFREPVLVTK